jgi:hypothetical protein
MSRSFVVVVAVLAACKGNNDKCGPAKKEALAALESAMTDARESQRLDKELADAASLARSYSAGADTFVADLNQFEQSLGCGEHVDCCARLAKANNRTEILAHAKDLKRADQPKPPALAPLVGELWTLLDKAEQLAPKEIAPWCKQVLVQIAHARSQGPAIWKQANDEANKRLSDAKAAVDARVRRDAALGEWRVAISGSKSITVAPELGDDTAAFHHAREAVERYQAACH